MSEVAWLRRQAVGWSLPRRGGALGPVMAELEFVQADPIRAPARAQDLVLRQRVAGYRAGDLERHYPSLDLDEDYLYAYGFTARRLRPLLHPRHHRHPLGKPVAHLGRREHDRIRRRRAGPRPREQVLFREHARHFVH